MARILRVIEYLGTEKQLEAWLQNSCADGVSPMFSPHQMTVWTVESDVPSIPTTAGTTGTGASDRVTPGSGRPLVRHEDYNNAKTWKEECEALEQILMDHLRQWPNEEYNEAAQRVLDRVRQVLAEDRGRI